MKNIKINYKGEVYSPDKVVIKRNGEVVCRISPKNIKPCSKWVMLCSFK